MKEKMKLVQIKEHSPDIKRVEEIYLSSFPEIERVEFECFFNGHFAGSGRMFGFYVDKKLVGFSFLSCKGNIAYLIYLAIAEEERGKGYGSLVLQILRRKSKKDCLMLCIEFPFQDEEKMEERLRRKHFYQKNGFYEADFIFDYDGWVYQPMFLGNFDHKECLDFVFECFEGCSNVRAVPPCKNQD